MPTVRSVTSVETERGPDSQKQISCAREMIRSKRLRFGKEVRPALLKASGFVEERLSRCLSRHKRCRCVFGCLVLKRLKQTRKQHDVNRLPRSSAGCFRVWLCSGVLKRWRRRDCLLLERISPYPVLHTLSFTKNGIPTDSKSPT